jgi:hypothetical protein
VSRNNSLHIHYTFSGTRAASNEGTKMPEQHTILGGKVHVYKRPNSGLCSAQAISPARIAAPAPKRRASPKPRKSPRTGTYSFAENSALERSKAKRPFARSLTSIYASTTSSRWDNATRNTWMASTGGRAFTWFPSSGTWASQRSPRERSRNTEFTDTKKQLLTAESHRDTAPSITKS